MHTSSLLHQEKSTVYCCTSSGEGHRRGRRLSLFCNSRAAHSNPTIDMWRITTAADEFHSTLYVVCGDGGLLGTDSPLAMLMNSKRTVLSHIYNRRFSLSGTHTQTPRLFEIATAPRRGSWLLNERNGRFPVQGRPVVARQCGDRRETLRRLDVHKKGRGC